MPPLSGWQRTNVLAAAEYLRELMQRSPADAKIRQVYEGLLEALDPTKRVIRMQREVSASRASVPIKERRARTDRRAGSDRRKVNLGPPDGIERRSAERRSGRDRRDVLMSSSPSAG
jgi:hypothetical protein